MNIREEDLPKAGPWPSGINNLAPEGSLPADENGRPIAFREADNVDLTKEGRVSRRQGYEACYAGSLVHSLWSDDALGFALFVDRGQLHSMDTDERATSLGVEIGDLPLSYSLVGDKVFFSNRSACGMLTVLDREVHEWGAPATPAVPPFDVLDGYGLPAGLYQVVITMTDALGRESGAERAVQVQLSDMQGLLLSGLPITASVNVYLSGPNDQVLRLAVRLPKGTPSYLLAGPADGIRLATALLDPMPPGQLTRLAGGRHWVADGRTLRWSPPFRFGMTDLAHNLIRFDNTIDLLEIVGDAGQGAGVYVAAGKRTYFLNGFDPASFSPVSAHSAGAVPGTSVVVPGQSIGMERDVDYTIWLSRKGSYVLGLPGGAITAINAGQAAVDDAAHGASLFAQRGGNQQVITTLRGPRTQGLAIKDRAAAHVIHVDR